mmetsp:Transcript_11964/g.19314  ORF Transcript_11964/g.19314 Transcript_11964/m.19314 type:complete len:263 (+) Transcript_11964:113-901(+)
MHARQTRGKTRLCIYLMYLLRKRLWKSLRMVSLMKRLACLGSPRVWFLNTTSSSQRRLTVKSAAPRRFKSGLPDASSSAFSTASASADSASRRADASVRSFLIRSSSASSAAVSSSSSSSLSSSSSSSSSLSSASSGLGTNVAPISPAPLPTMRSSPAPAALLSFFLKCFASFSSSSARKSFSINSLMVCWPSALFLRMVCELSSSLECLCEGPNMRAPPCSSWPLAGAHVGRWAVVMAGVQRRALVPAAKLASCPEGLACV